MTPHIAGFLQANILYTPPLSDMLRGYGGMGADFGQLAFGDAQTFFGVHATAEVEHHLGSDTGLFGEKCNRSTF